MNCGELNKETMTIQEATRILLTCQGQLSMSLTNIQIHSVVGSWTKRGNKAARNNKEEEIGSDGGGDNKEDKDTEGNQEGDDKEGRAKSKTSKAIMRKVAPNRCMCVGEGGQQGQQGQGR